MTAAVGAGMALEDRIKRRKRRARRRRWGKRLAACAVVAVMALTASWTVRDKPRQEPRRLPDRSALAWMVARSWLSPGDAEGFAARYPELSDLFLSASTGPAPWESR